MPALEALTVEADDPDAARAFYAAIGHPDGCTWEP